MAILTDMTVTALARGCEHNMHSWYLEGVRCAGGEVYGDDSLSWGYTPAHQGLADADSVIAFPQQVNDTLMQEMVKFFHNKQQSAWVTCGGTTTPDSVRLALKVWGFGYLFSGVGMACDLTMLNTAINYPAELTFQHLTDPSVFDKHPHPYAGMIDTDEKRMTLHKKFAMAKEHPQHTWIFAAFLDGVPVAHTILHLGAGVAGIYDVGVVEAQRRQGIARAIVAHACAFARDTLGYRVAILQNGAFLIPLYGGVGFKQVTTIDHWLLSEHTLQKALPSPNAVRQQLKHITLHGEKLQMALGAGNITEARQLIKAHPQIATQFDHAHNATALHIAAWAGYADVVADLIALGADLEAVEDEFGCTPFLWAVHGYSNTARTPQRDQLAAAKVLLDAGANANATNKWEESGLAMSDQNGEEAMHRLITSYQDKS